MNSPAKCACGCGSATALIKSTDLKRGYIKGEYRRFVLGHGTSLLLSGRTRARNGRVRIERGYAVVYCPEHPRARPNGCIGQHILVAEKALGRFLPDGVQVHHVNRIRSENAGANLVICENAKYHFLLHERMNAIADGVDPDTQQRCRGCRAIKSLDSYGSHRGRWNGKNPYCHPCSLSMGAAKRRRQGKPIRQLSRTGGLL